MNARIVIIAETKQRRVMPVTWELVSFARQLSLHYGGAIEIVVPGRDTTPSAADIAGSTGLDVTVIDNPGIDEYNPEIYTGALSALAAEARPHALIAAHTSRGYDFAPALAVRIGAHCVTAVEKMATLPQEIAFCHPVFGGKMMLNIIPEPGCTVFTVQPGAFPLDTQQPARPGRVTIRTSNITARRVVFTGRKTEEGDTGTLADADVIVAAGRGLGKKENLDLVRSFASIFSKSAVGGSRAACDRGWIEHRRQIGITGATVEPGLYVACGISGAAQHIAGMKHSKLIIAINSDPNAAIFNIADYGIVEKLEEFIPCVLDEYASGRS